MKPVPVPEAAATKIAELLADPGLNANERALLETLRSDNEKLTREVWPRLTRDTPGCEAEVVTLVLMAFQKAYAFNPPYPAKGNAAARRTWEATALESGMLSAGSLAVLANWLVGEMARSGLNLRGLFNERRALDTDLDFDEAMIVIARASEIFTEIHCLDILETKTDKFEDKAPRKRGYARWREVYFSNIMTQYFQYTVCKPMDKVVSALTLVAFGGRETTELSARSRRRGVADSAQK